MITDHYKLVRNKIPQIIAAEGKTVTFKGLTTFDDKRRELSNKLIEETNELNLLITDYNPSGIISDKKRKEVLNEIVDVISVVETIASLYGMSYGDVEDAFYKKIEDRGTFSQMMFLQTVEEE